MNEAESINFLGEFCGMRDVDCMTQSALQARYGFRQADVMVLFGGSILCGGDVLADAMCEQVAKDYVIVGGEGHTTEALRRRVHQEFPSIDTVGKPEAEVFSAYLETKYGLRADALEFRSTNCGSNITYLMELLDRRHLPHASIILTQDASMQRRMDAGLRKHAPRGITIVNFAAYRARVAQSDGALTFTEEIHGMWEMDRYLSLLLGEIPRLRDDAQGYGPNGKGFIAHVDIPPQVEEAFTFLKSRHERLVRTANPQYASK